MNNPNAGEDGKEKLSCCVYIYPDTSYLLTRAWSFYLSYTCLLIFFSILPPLGDLTTDFARQRVIMAGREVLLAPVEYRIISFLAQHARRTVTQDCLEEYVWGKEYVGEDHLLQVNMSRLRRKLEPDPTHPRYILTKKSVGYLLMSPS